MEVAGERDARSMLFGKYSLPVLVADVAFYFVVFFVCFRRVLCLCVCVSVGRYASVDRTELLGKDGPDGIGETRPCVLAEYSHAMGNSNGNLHKYWEVSLERGRRL